MGRVTRPLLVVAVFAATLASGRQTAAATLTSVTIAMGYSANVQFAPFYVAQARGYYRRAGLDIHFRYGIEPDLLKLASNGKVDFVNSGGDEVLAAGAKGLRVKYVMTQYSRFPAAVFALRTSGINTVQKLRGHTIGVPYTFGANYVGLLALLQRTHTPVSRVHIVSINFTQVASVATHRVDAAVGYAMNEPVQLRQEGYPLNEFDVYHWADIAGAGVATGDTEIARHPAIVKSFVRATLHGLADTLRDPNAAFGIAESAVPEIRAQQAIQRAVLQRCIDFWRPEAGRPLGWINPRIWSQTAQVLHRFKQIPRPVAATPFYTNRFVPAG